MGAEQSTPVEMSFYKRLAYQIVHVVKDSPADEAGLRPYYDFITHLPLIQTFTNSLLPYDEYVRESIAKHAVIELTVFNCATARIRRVNLNQGRYRRDRLDLTGFIIRPVIISDAILEVEHVQEVQVGSPAHEAGLVPNLDYVIATDEGNCFDLHRIQRSHNPTDYVQLYVFDIFVQTSRVVQLPSNCKSRFGCTLASGYLHRVPHSKKLTFYLRKTNNNKGQLETTSENINLNNIHDKKEQNNHINNENIFAKDNKSLECLNEVHKKELTKNEAVQTDDPNPNHSNVIFNNSTTNGIIEEQNSLKTVNNSFQDTKTNKDFTVMDDCCTFVTRIKLKQVIDNVDESDVLPVSVNLSKDVLRNFISEMIHYEKDDKFSNKKCHQ